MFLLYIEYTIKRVKSIDKTHEKKCKKPREKV